ncbi:MAG: A/G-specific adenine glycosylase [Zoogloeaceae bacterium]|jgi:A/G-specific adenine glycosylase|nr:A/G-specific adenine glycosylase [Zoogloeaceae bacterium]
MKQNPVAPRTFSARVIVWQKQYGRHDLPWRQPEALEQRNPYLVWLSEIMLQQTRVAAVREYFARFTLRFPCVAALASAPIEEVLALWAGLGYYARARNLHAAAGLIMRQWQGIFPKTARELAALPGIGRSTAAAIAAFAFNERAAILDGNVRRVLCRCFAAEKAGEPAGKALWTLAESLLPEARDMPAYTQGLMDLGASVCLSRAPRCAECPLRAQCRAALLGRQEDFPAPKERAPKALKRCVFLCVSDGERVLLRRRPFRGIWGGLLCFPEEEADFPAVFAERLKRVTPETFSERAHVFTHFVLRYTPRIYWIHPLRGVAASDGEWRWIALEEAGKAGIPAPVARILKEMTDMAR